MAILSKNEKKVLDAWAAEFPDESVALFAGLNQKLGPVSDPEELLRRFQIDAPGLWNELLTALNARYSATTADVEREVGRSAIAAANQSTEIQRLQEQLGQARAAEAVAKKEAETQRNRYQQDVDKQQRRNTVNMLKGRLVSACNADSGCDYDASRSGLDDLANQIAELTPPGFNYRKDTGLLIELVDRARRLDGTTSIVPSGAAVELVFESEFG